MYAPPSSSHCHPTWPIANVIAHTWHKAKVKLKWKPANNRPLGPTASGPLPASRFGPSF
ncbi:Agno [Betapolyomavirus lepweddellii]|uniref:Agno n=1 Tax=Betapolyomavirus lepweddellii TaxID=1925019 RepID=A0A1L4AB51_9POLY|nr:Agno [Betapolyomavirus lepweddellii]API65513.1 Agno [Betapolyomavirus lepweddellii]